MYSRGSRAESEPVQEENPSGSCCNTVAPLSSQGHDKELRSPSDSVWRLPCLFFSRFQSRRHPKPPFFYRFSFVMSACSPFSPLSALWQVYAPRSSSRNIGFKPDYCLELKTCRPSCSLTPTAARRHRRRVYHHCQLSHCYNAASSCGSSWSIYLWLRRPLPAVNPHWCKSDITFVQREHAPAAISRIRFLFIYGPRNLFERLNSLVGA